MPGLHPMVRMSVTINGGAGFPFRANEEMYLPFSDTHLRNNTKQNLYFSAWMNYSSYTSNSDYSTCISSPDYASGLNCELKFKEDGSTIYLPQAKIPEKIQENIASIDTPTDPSELQESHWEDTNEKPIHSQSTTGNDNSQEDVQKTMTNEINQNTPSTPETGTEVMDYSTSREEPTLPWWLIVLAIVGFVAFFHFFGPKSPKKPRKTLDKKNCLR